MGSGQIFPPQLEFRMNIVTSSYKVKYENFLKSYYIMWIEAFHFRKSKYLFLTL